MMPAIAVAVIVNLSAVLGPGSPDPRLEFGAALAAVRFDISPAARVGAPPVRQSGWLGRHPVIAGTLIGAGGMMLWEGVSCRGRSCKAGTAALVGAGGGAYTGLIVGAIQKARRNEPVGRGTKIAIVAGAAGGALALFLACYGAGGCGGVS
jgi:hypothetical protein